MPTYSKETALYDTGAIAAGIDEAGDTADTYITAVDQNGIKVHAANNVGTNYAGIDATGMDVVRGGTSVAKFGETTRIGKEYVQGATNNESHVELDYHSLKLVDKEGSTYFHVSDLRDRSGKAEITTTFVGDGDTTVFTLPVSSTSFSYTVSVSDGSGGTIDKGIFNITFSSAPSDGATITVTYTTSDEFIKAYTVGFRPSQSVVGPLSYAEGLRIEATEFASHAEGAFTSASGRYSHAENANTSASGTGSHAEGHDTTASGEYSHAEGDDTTASGECSHAEGGATTASGRGSHAEGIGAAASTDAAHAEGRNTNARGIAAHAEGMGTFATRPMSHAEGGDTMASGWYSHAQNFETIAGYDCQTAIGKYNSNDSANAFEVGNGTADDARSNAATIGWDGNYLGQAMAGIIQMFAGATPPTGWLVCDGSAVSRTTYATLFAAIGTTWGTGDGSTTFNLPDLRGRAPIGAGTGSGLTARTLGTQNIGSENVQAHTHSISRTTNVAVSDSGHTHPAATNNYYYALGSATFEKQSGHAQSGSSGLTNAVRQSGTVSSNKNTGSGKASLSVTQPVFSVGAVSGATTGTEGNMQPSAVVNFIICTGKTS